MVAGYRRGEFGRKDAGFAGVDQVAGRGQLAEEAEPLTRVRGWWNRLPASGRSRGGLLVRGSIRRVRRGREVLVGAALGSGHARR